MSATKIKVGQIRKPKECFKNKPYGNMKVVVTAINIDMNECSFIAEDGWCIGNIPIEFAEDMTVFIAEYPTWKDAINSREFGGKSHINDDDDFEPLGCHGCGDW